MASSDFKALKQFIAIDKQNPPLSLLKKQLDELASGDIDAENLDTIVQIYQAAARIIGSTAWSQNDDDFSIEGRQKLFQEMEDLIALRGRDDRHQFVVIIPVADRPRHLQSCLQSLLTLCQSFHYGGYKNQRFNKVSVIIADDSKEPGSIRKHKELTRDFNKQGLETLYFGQEEQLAQLEKLTASERQALANLLGDFDSTAFYHKGPSMMRNITYLKLNEMSNKSERLLFHFVDSDQEFRVKIQSDGKDCDVYAINYFHELDAIFSQRDVSILTGKVVGDPPVSPAVMAGTFLDDIIAFLRRMAATEHNLPCQFHHQSNRKEHEAAYHDMTDLFGFKPTSEAYHYRCSLTDTHDHSQCFADFSSKLGHFFYGEHPTRKSYFNPTEAVSTSQPARTIYTGNYLFNADGLKYFIPFARLKLRMAGPVLGRIIKSEIKQRFVSANLPMLHKRTVEDSGQSEFRPGINNEQKRIDLSGEFERQYFGDVMLFTMENLTALGYPVKPVSEELILRNLQSTDQEMRNNYSTKQGQIMEKLSLLKSIFHASENWWNTTPNLESSRHNFSLFIENIEQNFTSGSRCYELIDSNENRSQRFKEMSGAISGYMEERRLWEDILKQAS